MGMKVTARLLLNKAFIQRYLDALSGRDKPPNLVNEFVADERLRHCIGVIEGAFPRFEISTEDVVGKGDKIVIRGTMRGIHSGELMGIAPTRRQVTMPFTIIFRVDGGTIIEHWPSVDLFGVLRQLQKSPDDCEAITWPPRPTAGGSPERHRDERRGP